MAVTGTVIVGSCSIASVIVSYRIHTYLAYGHDNFWIIERRERGEERKQTVGCKM